MQIQRLQVSNIRNLSRIALSELGPINIFYGPNGSGKTSLLEAIHLLLMGKSFRQAQLRPLLTEGEAQCVIFAELVGPDQRRLTLGQSRQRDGSKPSIKLNGEQLRLLSDLVKLVPVQVLGADSFEMLTGGPANRRQFLDWGLFHVEPKFYPAWKLAQRALKQRNSLIRHGKIDRDQIQLWGREYARYGEQVDQMRRQYIDQLLPVSRSMISALSPSLSERLDVSYTRGWLKDLSLDDALQQGLDADIQQGHTRQGPHRADLKVYAGDFLANETLSRGQLKILVAAFHLAQAQLLRDVTEKTSIFLVDDLSAELDSQHCRRLCAALEALGVQVLMTSILGSDITDYWSQPSKVRLFHVERGEINPDNRIGDLNER